MRACACGDLWQEPAACRAFPSILFCPAACCRSSVVEHSLGKGEVDSSILSGSTSCSTKSKHLQTAHDGRLRSGVEQRSSRRPLCLFHFLAKPSAIGARILILRGNIFVVTGGKYSVWFKTPNGEAPGLVCLDPDGRLSGGDTTFAYDGNWAQEGERFKATLSAKRAIPGPPGVFGMDEIDIVVTGTVKDGASVYAPALQSSHPV